VYFFLNWKLKRITSFFWAVHEFRIFSGEKRETKKNKKNEKHTTYLFKKKESILYPSPHFN
jgi:hypothetical protein